MFWIDRHVVFIQDDNLDYECVLDIENQSVVVEALVEPDAEQQSVFIITCSPHQVREPEIHCSIS